MKKAKIFLWHDYESIRRSVTYLLQQKKFIESITNDLLSIESLGIDIAIIGTIVEQEGMDLEALLKVKIPGVTVISLADDEVVSYGNIHVFSTDFERLYTIIPDIMKKRSKERVDVAEVMAVGFREAEQQARGAAVKEILQNRRKRKNL